jgi:hypothetical protein
MCFASRLKCRVRQDEHCDRVLLTKSACSRDERWQRSFRLPLRQLSPAEIRRDVRSESRYSSARLECQRIYSPDCWRTVPFSCRRSLRQGAASYCRWYPGLRKKRNWLSSQSLSILTKGKGRPGFPASPGIGATPRSIALFFRFNYPRD